MCNRTERHAFESRFHFVVGKHCRTEVDGSPTQYLYINELMFLYILLFFKVGYEMINFLNFIIYFHFQNIFLEC